MIGGPGAREKNRAVGTPRDGAACTCRRKMGYVGRRTPPLDSSRQCAGYPAWALALLDARSGPHECFSRAPLIAGSGGGAAGSGSGGTAGDPLLRYPGPSPARGPGMAGRGRGARGELDLALRRQALGLRGATASGGAACPVDRLAHGQPADGRRGPGPAPRAAAARVSAASLPAAAAVLGSRSGSRVRRALRYFLPSPTTTAAAVRTIRMARQLPKIFLSLFDMAASSV